MSDKLAKLVERCKCSVTLRINEHKGYYQTAQQALEELRDWGKHEPEQDVWDEIIKRDMLVDLHFYPDSSIGFYKIIHFDLDAALDEALKRIDSN